MNVSDKSARRIRHRRVLKKLRAGGRLRLIVRKTDSNIFAQIIDDKKRVTVVEASSLSADMGDLRKKKNAAASQRIGELLAKRALDKGVKTVVFDRNGYPYHGKIKLLADSARGAGLQF